MYIKYHPEGDDLEQVFPFVPRDLNTFDSEAIEHVTGWDWNEFEMKLKRGNIKARRAALWVCLRRLHRNLKFADVSFKQSEVEVQFDKVEIAELIKGIEEFPGDVMEGGIDKDVVLKNIGKQLEDAPDAPGDPKAPVPTSGDDTPSQ